MATQVLTLPTPVIRVSRSTRAHLSPAELLAVLKIARAKSTRDWCMILLAYRHGMRASEVCGLKLSDVSLKDQTIRVARLKGSMLTVQSLFGHRGVPLLDELAALRAWLRVRRPDWLKLPVRQPEGRQIAPQRILSFVPGNRRSRWIDGRETTPACPETFPGFAPGRWQRQPRAGKAIAGTPINQFHDAVRWGK
jgi:integrase